MLVRPIVSVLRGPVTTTLSKVKLNVSSPAVKNLSTTTTRIFTDIGHTARKGNQGQESANSIAFIAGGLGIVGGIVFKELNDAAEKNAMQIDIPVVVPISNSEVTLPFAGKVVTLPIGNAAQLDIPVAVPISNSEATLFYAGKAVMFPMRGNAIDISKADGVKFSDPGLRAVITRDAGLSHIDGKAGKLWYQGYPIEEIAANCSFPEVIFLLLNPDLRALTNNLSLPARADNPGLPNQAQLQALNALIAKHAALPDYIKNVCRELPRDMHPMDMLQGLVPFLAGACPDGTDQKNPLRREIAAIDLAAKLPTLVAMMYRHSMGQEFVAPRSDLSYAENFLYMMFSQPGQEYQIDPVLVRAFDRILTLHAEHGQNASTFTATQISSTGAHSFACVAGALGSLSGPKHGGANEDVLKMLDEVGSIDNIPAFLERVKKKEVKAPGFGHAVYKAPDPRSVLMREICHEVLQTLDPANPQSKRFALAMALAEAAESDDYFVSRGLYPNVDLFSGIVFSSLGIPPEFFTVIFGFGRGASGYPANSNHNGPLMRAGEPGSSSAERHVQSIDQRL